MKLAFVLPIVLAGLNLQASTIITLFNGELTSEAISRTVDGSNYFDNSTGMFSFLRKDGTEVGIPSNGTFFAFCIEPREFVTAGTIYTYDFNTLDQGATNIGGMGFAKADLIRELFGRYYPVIGAPIGAEQASAIQIAIWEIVREDKSANGLDVYHGLVIFQNPADALALALAQTYLKSLDGTGPRDNNLYALTSGSLNTVGAQDVVVQVGAAAPEPLMLGTTGLALIGLALMLRRRHAAC